MDSGADPSAASAVLVSTVDLSSVRLPNAVIRRAGTAGGWLAVTLTLPEGLADGSYEYRVEADGAVLSSGCAQIGDYDRWTRQYERKTIYKQYERK